MMCFHEIFKQDSFIENKFIISEPQGFLDFSYNVGGHWLGQHQKLFHIIFPQKNDIINCVNFYEHGKLLFIPS